MGQPVGQFEMTRELVFNDTASAAKILAELEFVPITASYFGPSGRVLRYVGFSPFFDSVDIMGVIPVYDITVTVEDDKTVSSVSATRRQE